MNPEVGKRLHTVAPTDGKKTMIHCKDCVWYAPVESMPEAERMHQVMWDAFGDILPKRDGEVGICRKVTFSAERPVLTNENGYCHRAEKKED